MFGLLGSISMVAMVTGFHTWGSLCYQVELDSRHPFTRKIDAAPVSNLCRARSLCGLWEWWALSCAQGRKFRHSSPRRQTVALSLVDERKAQPSFRSLPTLARLQFIHRRISALPKRQAYPLHRDIMNLAALVERDLAQRLVHGFGQIKAGMDHIGPRTAASGRCGRAGSFGRGGDALPIRSPWASWLVCGAV